MPTTAATVASAPTAEAPTAEALSTEAPAAKVFLVDSDPSTRREAMQALLPHGFELLIGEGPFEATTAILRAEPDLVILGDSMTHEFGLALVGRLFSLPTTADTPVMVIANTPEKRLAAEKAGATHVLSGPLAEDALRRAVATQLGLPGGLDHAPVSLLNDVDRLAAVRALRDSSGAVDFDEFTKLTSDQLRTPVSLVTFIETDRQVYASHVGLTPPWSAAGSAPLEYSYCQYAITSRQPLIIDDTSTHPLVASSPSVSESDWIAYAGIPLITADGHAVGALCAIDHRPRQWTPDDIRTLEDLAGILTTQLDSALTAPATGRHRRH